MVIQTIKQIAYEDKFNLDRGYIVLQSLVTKIDKTIYLYEIDTNYKFHLNYIQLVKENYTFKELNDNKINETVTRIKYKDFIIKEQRLISLSDLFGCYNGKLTSLDQIKGIYYSYGKFYLILKQIYFVYDSRFSWRKIWSNK